MACPFPVVGYVLPPQGTYGQCCISCMSIMRWIVNNSSGNFYYNGCYGYKKIQGTQTPSVHGTGRAIDISVRNARVGSGQNNMLTDVINKYLVPQTCNLGIQRMIWQRKIWDAKDTFNQKWGLWRPFNGPQSHNDHLHLEISPAYCSKWRDADINFIFGVIGNPSVILNGQGTGNVFPKDPELPPTAPTPIFIDPSPDASSGGSPTGTGGGTGTVTPPTTPPTTATTPVWNVTVPLLSPCTACGGPFTGLNSNPEDGDVTALQFTHCGGTGAICIKMASGETCSTGTAPVLGNFPGPVKDFIFWGDGGYGLSADGYNVWNLGGASPAVIETQPPNNIPPWDHVYGINPTTIGVAAVTNLGFKSARATVNSIAKYSCCPPA